MPLRSAPRVSASVLPWQDEQLSIATHKANAHIDLSG